MILTREEAYAAANASNAVADAGASITMSFKRGVQVMRSSTGGNLLVIKPQVGEKAETERYEDLTHFINIYGLTL